METLIDFLNIELLGDFRVLHIILIGIGIAGIKIIFSLFADLSYVGNNKQNRR